LWPGFAEGPSFRNPR